jgi:uncharacterized membrane protein
MMFWLSVLFRWLHVAAAVVGVGGTVAMRFAILPALERLPNGAEVLAAIREPFKKIIHSALGLLLITGFYNYLMVAIPKLRAQREAGDLHMAPYHGIMGAKILLSLALFTIAIMLLKPVPALHENRKTWLSVNVVLGMVIMLLAAYLRRLW